MIEVESLTKHRAGKPVLDAVTFRGAERGVTVLVGPSGGGKSTLLRCLNGLESFEGGAVTIAGHRLVGGPQGGVARDELRRDVGMVFQQFNLFPHLSVLDNVMLGPRVVLREPAEAARERAVALLDRVGVAIARALAMRPRVMLFDEPTSALDPQMTAEVLEVIVDLARGGQTMVVVTHDHGFARRAATWVVELVAGRVARQGTADELL
jgi:ABC-type polar amino acid transport system ATPase subunit